MYIRSGFNILLYQYLIINIVIEMEQLNHYAQTLQPHLDEAFILVDYWLLRAEQELYQLAPRLQDWNRFEKFLFLNAFIIAIMLAINILVMLNPSKIYKRVMKIVFSLPMVRKKVEEELQQTKTEFMATYPQKYRSSIKSIPYKPMQPNLGNDCDIQSVKGYLSGSRYPDKKHSDFVINLSREFAYSNPLHFDLHPQVKQMEVQVLKMCARMMNFYGDKYEKEVVGGFFSGGTESILMAILSYRQYGIKYRGVTNPNLIISDTGHAAALKACDLFGIQPRIVSSDSKYQMSISGMKRNMDSNTICVYASYPNYPYGTVDPVHDIASYCRGKGVPVHVDMCLGGYLVPFLKGKDGQPMLTVPSGVTSISMDCHKYGLAAKGASVLLFSSQKYRRQHIFVTAEWPGGLYGTIGISGSRSGANVASAWISMMRLGVKGYTKNAENIQKATKTLASELKKMGYKVFGDPEICTIGFTHPKCSLNLIKDQMKKKGWDLPMIQKPIALHYSFTPINSVKIDQMVADFKEVTPLVIKLTRQQKNLKIADAELYGACAKIPDGQTKRIIMETVIDLFLEI